MLIWGPCLIVSRFHGNDAGVSGHLFSDFLWLFFFFHPTDKPTQNQETYSTLNERKGDDLTALRFLFELPYNIASAYFCMLVFCFVLFFFCRWNKLKLKLYKDPLYSLWRFSSAHKKMKNAMIYWLQGQWDGVRARYCVPVHSCAVKWSRKTKGKMTVDRLFTSRHEASFMMGLIASPCSWSWFKVLTSISWCPVCCRDMFHKDLSTATESAATLSTVREMMNFRKAKRSYVRSSREGVFYIFRNYQFSAFSARKNTLPTLWYCQCWKRLSRNVAWNEPLKLFAKRYKLKQTNKQTNKKDSQEITHKTDWQRFLNKTLNTPSDKSMSYLKLDAGIHSLRNLFWLVKDTFWSEIVSNNTINPTWRVFEKVHQHKRIYHTGNIKLNVWWVGRVVSASDLQSGDAGFESRSGHLLDLFSVVPSSSPLPRL